MGLDNVASMEAIMQLGHDIDLTVVLVAACLTLRRVFVEKFVIFELGVRPLRSTFEIPLTWQNLTIRWFERIPSLTDLYDEHVAAQ